MPDTDMPAQVRQREWLQLRSSEHASRWAVAVLYLAAYIILEWASFIHVHKGLPITPWDPGLGVVFALMIRGGPLSGLVLFAGMVVAETLVLQNDVDWPIDTGPRSRVNTFASAVRQPRLQSTHSTVASSCATARFVTRLNTFVDQFWTVV